MPLVGEKLRAVQLKKAADGIDCCRTVEHIGCDKKMLPQTVMQQTRRLQLLLYAALPVRIQLRGRHGAQCGDGIVFGGVCTQCCADDKEDGGEQLCCSLDAHRAAFCAEQRFGILCQQGKTSTANGGSVTVGERSAFQADGDEIGQILLR